MSITGNSLVVSNVLSISSAIRKRGSGFHSARSRSDARQQSVSSSLKRGILLPSLSPLCLYKRNHDCQIHHTCGWKHSKGITHPTQESLNSHPQLNIFSAESQFILNPWHYLFCLLAFRTSSCVTETSHRWNTDFALSLHWITRKA